MSGASDKRAFDRLFGSFEPKGLHYPVEGASAETVLEHHVFVDNKATMLEIRMPYSNIPANKFIHHEAAGDLQPFANEMHCSMLVLVEAIDSTIKEQNS